MKPQKSEAHPMMEYLTTLCHQVGYRGFEPEHAIELLGEASTIPEVNQVFFRWYTEFQAGESRAREALLPGPEKIGAIKAAQNQVLQKEYEELSKKAAKLYGDHMTTLDLARRILDQMRGEDTRSAADWAEMIRRVQEITVFDFKDMRLEEGQWWLYWVTREGALVQFPNEKLVGDCGQVQMRIRANGSQYSCAPYRKNKLGLHPVDGVAVVHPHFMGQDLGTFRWICTGQVRVQDYVKRGDFLGLMQQFSALYTHPREDSRYSEQLRNVLAETARKVEGTWPDEPNKEVAPDAPPHQ
jgi:hypothetical protein